MATFTTNLNLRKPATTDFVDVVTDVNDNMDTLDEALPLGILGYAQTTADQGGITAEVDLTSLAATVTVADSRKIKITAQFTWRNNTADQSSTFKIKEGAATLQTSYANSNSPVSNLQTHRVEVIVDAPSAGSHTYKITGLASGGTMDIIASSGSIAFFAVEDIGPA